MNVKLSCIAFWVILCLSFGAYAQEDVMNNDTITSQIPPIDSSIFIYKIFDLDKFNEIALAKAKKDSLELIPQDIESIRTLKIGNLDLRNLPYEFDDIMLVVHGNRTGLQFSKDYKNLNYSNGFGIGLEAIVPVVEKIFFHYGLIYSSHNFTQNSGVNELRFNQQFLEVPTMFAWEMPIFRQWDWRIHLGANTRYMLKAQRTSGEYIEGENWVVFDENEFWRWDLHFNFATSIERYNCYLRLRGTFGTFPLFSGATESRAGFYLDFGYFLFRNLRR